jgi:hypothetical protein
MERSVSVKIMTDQDSDPGVPKTYGSGSGSGTLVPLQFSWLQFSIKMSNLRNRPSSFTLLKNPGQAFLNKIHFLDSYQYFFVFFFYNTSLIFANDY